MTGFGASRAVALSFTLSILLLLSCAPANPETTFAIYLPDPMISVQQIMGVDLPTLPLHIEPIISGKDIQSYHLADHEIVLNDAAAIRLQQLHIPVNGLPFVVCAEDRPVYWGAFWTPLSSLSFDGPVIQLPVPTERSTIRIQWGYPHSHEPPVNDPRSRPEILNALKRLGKLEIQRVNLPIIQ